VTTIEAIAIVRNALKGNTDQFHRPSWIPPRIAEAMLHLADRAASELLKPRAASRPAQPRPRRGRGGR
jgi:hypothetical protein